MKVESIPKLEEQLEELNDKCYSLHCETLKGLRMDLEIKDKVIRELKIASDLKDKEIETFNKCEKD